MRVRSAIQFALPNIVGITRDVGRISNLEARHFEGTFFLKKNGAFSKDKKGTSLLIAKPWRHMPPMPPVPTSMGITLVRIDSQIVSVFY